jgi:hypothetical protein
MATTIAITTIRLITMRMAITLITIPIAVIMIMRSARLEHHEKQLKSIQNNGKHL